MKLNRNQLAKYLDHTMLKPDATVAMIDQTVDEAIKYQTPLSALIHTGLSGSTKN